MTEGGLIYFGHKTAPVRVAAGAGGQTGDRRGARESGFERVVGFAVIGHVAEVVHGVF